ncbi:A disintegrin and metalloproteinase with thrombospondin motifs 20-like [Ptychodera flava]|uniref:A disintegrin and metalloproteinase with thrombospondin motifs 20-like n=1 Tax=Ptychodera flava TaxID=63121 RepID=UPI00396A8402
MAVSMMLAVLVVFLLPCHVAAFYLDEGLQADTVQRYARTAGLNEVREYDVVYPKTSQRWRREAALSDDDEDDHMSVTAFGETYKLRLKRSDDFFVTPFVEYCGDGGIRWDRFPVDVDKSCYHSGYITGVENSLVAIRVCNGYDVSGWLIGNYTLFLHPLESEDLPSRLRRDTEEHPHIAFLVDNSVAEEFLKNDVVILEDGIEERLLKRSEGNDRIERDTESSPRPTYIELMVTVDKTAQEKLGNNTIPHVLAMVNLVATTFKHPSSEDMDLNVRLVRLILVDEDKEGLD